MLQLTNLIHTGEMFCDASQFVSAMGLVAGISFGSAIAFMRLFYIKFNYVMQETNERITSKVITLVSVIILTTLVIMQMTGKY